MSDEDYDGTVFLDRKLTADEISELKITLLPYFLSGGGAPTEDVTDLLDYAFAMISNAKDIDHVKQELTGMEMEYCPPETVEKVGRELSTFVTRLNGGGGGGNDGAAESNDSSKPGSRVVSLKVSQSHAFTNWNVLNPMFISMQTWLTAFVLVNLCKFPAPRYCP